MRQSHMLVQPHATRACFALRLKSTAAVAAAAATTGVHRRTNACKAPEVRGDRDMIFQFSAPEIEVGKCTTPHCFVMDELAVRGQAARE